MSDDSIEPETTSTTASAAAGHVSAAETTGDPRPIPEAIPRDEPCSIHEIATQLLRPFHVREGRAQLAGCTFEARPVLRLSAGPQRCGEAGDGFAYYGPNGKRLDGAEIDRAGLRTLEPIHGRLRPGDRASLARWIQVAQAESDSPRESTQLIDAHRRVMGQHDRPLDANETPRDPSESPLDPSDAMVIWSYWASGRIVIQFRGGPSTSILFAGWARDYATGRQLPPPLRCPRSGATSYDCLLLEDGSITVAPAVERCRLTDRELLRDQLVRCEISGNPISKQLAVRCATTGKPADPELLVPCQWCGCAVLPQEVSEGKCARCRQLKGLDASDSSLRQFQQQHPEIASRLGPPARWEGWIGSERALVAGVGVMARRMVLFDPRDATVLRTAHKGRWSADWQWDRPSP